MCRSVDQRSREVVNRASMLIMDELRKNVKTTEDVDLVEQTVCLNLMAQGIHQIAVACKMLQDRWPEATNRSMS